jgi:hypothetical protein
MNYCAPPLLRGYSRYKSQSDPAGLSHVDLQLPGELILNICDNDYSCGSATVSCNLPSEVACRQAASNSGYGVRINGERQPY